MPSTRASRVCLFAAVVVLVGAQLGHADVESDVRDAVTKAVQKAPLRGTWATVAKHEEGMPVKVQAIVDSDPEIGKRQLADLEQVAKAAAGGAEVAVESVATIPFAKFLAEVRSKLQAAYPGATVEDAYFAPGVVESQVRLILHEVQIAPEDRPNVVPIGEEVAGNLLKGINQKILVRSTFSQTVASRKQVPASKPNQKTPAVASKIPPALESELRDAMTVAVKNETSLHGVWVWVPKLKEGYALEVNAIVDSQPEVADAQIKELKRVAKAVVKNDNWFEIYPIEKLPFRKLVDELRLDVELETDLSGAAVEDAYFDAGPSDADVILMLVLRVLDDKQRQMIMDLARQKVDTIFAGLDRKIDVIKSKAQAGEGVVVTPSPEIASYCVTRGAQLFAAKKYADAYQYFTQAHQEAPTRVDVQYWRVVSLIGSGREPHAKRLLQGLAKANRQNGNIPNEAVVFRSLEQVQGPIRWKLIDLENSLFCKDCK